jgi:hypothetical protein
LRFINIVISFSKFGANIVSGRLKGFDRNGDNS